MEKNAKNFAIWMALNSSPTFFTQSASFYGGADFSGAASQLRKAFCEKYYIKTGMFDGTDSQIMKQCMVIGIDWDASSLPESDTASRFTDTFHDAEMIDIVYGTLVLVDGQRIEYFAECSLDMNQFGMMQKFFSSTENMV